MCGLEILVISIVKSDAVKAQMIEESGVDHVGNNATERNRGKDANDSE